MLTVVVDDAHDERGEAEYLFFLYYPPSTEMANVMSVYSNTVIIVGIQESY